MVFFLHGYNSIKIFSYCSVSQQDKPEQTLIYMFVGISSDPPVSGHSDGIRNASDLQWGVGGGPQQKRVVQTKMSVVLLVRNPIPKDQLTVKCFRNFFQIK